MLKTKFTVLLASMMLLFACTENTATTTPVDGGEFIMKILSSSEDILEVTVTNIRSQSDPYIVGVLPSSSAQKSTQEIVDEVISQIKSKSETFDPSIVDEKFVFKAKHTINLTAQWGLLDVGQDYQIVAFTIDEKGKHTGILKNETVTIGASALRPQSGTPFPTLLRSAYDGVVLNVDMNGYEGIYYAAVCPAWEYDELLGSDPLTMAETFISNEYTENLQHADNIKVFDKGGMIDLANPDAWIFDANKEYVIAIFGTNAQAEVTSDVVIIKTTTEPYKANNAKVEIATNAIDDIVVSVTNTADMGNYMIVPIETAIFENEYSGQIDFIYSMVQSLIDNGADLTTPNGIYLFNGDAEINISEHWQILGDKDYSLFVYSIDENARQSNENNLSSFTAPSYPKVTEQIESITVSEIGVKDALINVTAGEFSSMYYVAPFAVEKYQNLIVDELEGDLRTLAEIMMDFEVNEQFTDFTTPFAGLTYIGDAELYLSNTQWNIYPDTEYFIIAFGVNANGTISSDIFKSENFRTLPVSENPIKISVSEIRDTRATVTFDPEISGESFFYDVLPKADYEATTLAEHIKTLEIKYSGYISMFHVGKARVEKKFVDLTPGVEYVAVAANYIYGSGLSSDTIYSETFFTLEEAPEGLEVPTEITFTDVEFGEIKPTTIDQYSFEIKILPADKNMTYLYSMVPKSTWDSSTPEEIAITLLQDMYSRSQTANFDFDQYLANSALVGDESYLEYAERDEEIIIYAFGIDTSTALPTTKLQTFTVATE